MDHFKKLDEANKLIFVRDYCKAKEILEEIVQDKVGGQNLLFHFRRIELSTSLNSASQVKNEYLSLIKFTHLAQEKKEVCVALTEQVGALRPSSKLLPRFIAHVRKNGASAPALFGAASCLSSLGRYESAIETFDQCLEHDPCWYPAYFGLSQAYFKRGNHEKGSYYFRLYEKNAPYNIYGNCNTHRSVCEDFISKNQYEEAQKAVSILTQWWIEEKSHCPLEIAIFEQLMTAYIASHRKDQLLELACYEKASREAIRLVANDKVDISTFHFISNLFEEFKGFEIVVKSSLKILEKVASCSDALSFQGNSIEIYAQSAFARLYKFCSLEVLEEKIGTIYSNHSDSRILRHYWLVSRLLKKQVNVEVYLSEKESVLEQMSHKIVPAVRLSRLLKLNLTFEGDSDVHAMLAQTYKEMGNDSKASAYIESMYKLDPNNKEVRLGYVTYLLEHSDDTLDIELLESISYDRYKDFSRYIQLNWLKAINYAKNQDFQKACLLVQQLLFSDPWNLSYLKAYSLWALHSAKVDKLGARALANLPLYENFPEGKSNFWARFLEDTTELSKVYRGSLTYTRCKLYLLAKGINIETINLFIHEARDCPKQGIYDLLRLLNTNFDCALLYFALGLLHKRLWQLESSSSWFEQVLAHPKSSEREKNMALLEIVDSYSWAKTNLSKGYEIMIGILAATEKSTRSYLTMAHICILTGRYKRAQEFLNTNSDTSFGSERNFLVGLLQYRRGRVSQAKTSWEMVLKDCDDDIRSYHMKKEVLRLLNQQCNSGSDKGSQV